MMVGWILSSISLQALWLFVIGGSIALALNVLGYQRVLEEREEPLPLVGALAEEWFGGLTSLAEPEDESDG